MGKNKPSTEQNFTKSAHRMPDIEIIDLEEETSPGDDSAAEAPDEAPPRKGFRINSHIVFAVSILFVILFIVYRLKNWGVFISQEHIRDNIEGTLSDTLDLMMPLTDENGTPIPLNTEDGLSIVFFGNAPLADDRDSKDNLVSMIGDMADATVYNCSISGSYLAAEWPTFVAESRPLDAYTLYWLSVYAGGAGTIDMFQQASAALGENEPEDAKQALDLLGTIDFSTVDVIAIMYDAYDYLIGHYVTNEENPTDITSFTGNLEASIEYLQRVFPHIRIIVMSPTYAFSDKLDEDGNYISSDIARYGQGYLSNYVQMEGNSCSLRQVSFVDHLYGTITQDNALDYLTDNRHLNVEGRKLVAQRFMQALNCYNNSGD